MSYMYMSSGVIFNLDLMQTRFSLIPSWNYPMHKMVLLTRTLRRGHVLPVSLAQWETGDLSSGSSTSPATAVKRGCLAVSILAISTHYLPFFSSPAAILGFSSPNFDLVWPRLRVGSKGMIKTNPFSSVQSNSRLMGSLSKERQDGI